MRHSLNPLTEDLDHIIEYTRELWEEVRGRRVFITGGTGFFGCWLLESFAWANDRLQLNAKAIVLSRNPEALKDKAAHLYYHPAIQFLKNDIKSFVFPEGQFSHLIHGAVYQHPTNERPNNLSMISELLKGTQHVLDFCVHARIDKMLLISTGAVYGRIPNHITRIPEGSSDTIDPTDSSKAYHHVRRMMESLCTVYAETHSFEAKIARCFSFIGPYLPLNGRFAVSDFILDAISGKPVTVKGSGRTVRSYMYMADLAIWLWTILFRGINCTPYNVGSEFPITIREMAERIAHESVPPLDVLVLGKSYDGIAQNHYVPDTTRAQSEIGVRQFVPLDHMITKTMHWYRSCCFPEESSKNKES